MPNKKYYLTHCTVSVMSCIVFAMPGIGPVGLYSLPVGLSTGSVVNCIAFAVLDIGSVGCCSSPPARCIGSVGLCSLYRP